MDEPVLNAHNKTEWEPAHTAEHLLNATMTKMFACPRSRNAHVERKKCKCDYFLTECPTPEQVTEIEAKINEVIKEAIPVTIEFMPKAEASSIVDLSKLPEDASDTLRIVRIGSYDACACIGAHVGNTSEIGEFKILSHDFKDGVWRVRWKVINFLLALIMITSCAPRSERVIATPPQERHMTGAYTDQREPSEEEVALLRNVTDGQDMTITPLSVSTQVVAGLNYKFWCRYQDGGDYGHCWVVIYRDLQGNVSLTSITKEE